MVIKEALEKARELLVEKNIDPREARLLLAYSMGIDLSKLIICETCTEEEYRLFLELISRRTNGEPFAYIIGYKEFMKLKFWVDENVLIPREDTEILVTKAIESDKKNILDMCTGSGCIAISLAKYIKDSNVRAVDISPKALEVARKNAKLNDVNVEFIESDLFEKVNDKYDLIVSNPPYIRKSDIDELQIEVQNEPKLALDGGEDGLDFYKKIAKDAYAFLNNNGYLMFEIGFDQGEAVSEILKEKYVDIEVLKDFSGNDRVVVAKRG